MIVGREREVDGHYVGTRLHALVLPGGDEYIGGRTTLAVRWSVGSYVLGLARIWLPVLAVAWPLLFGWAAHAWIEAVVLAVVAARLHQRTPLPPDELRELRLLGSQTGLRLAPSQLLPSTRAAKLDMLGALLQKGGLAPDPEWLVSVLPEIPLPALPLVYAYARYAGDEPPWSDCAEKILEQIDRNEQL